MSTRFIGFTIALSPGILWERHAKSVPIRCRLFVGVNFRSGCPWGGCRFQEAKMTWSDSSPYKSIPLKIGTL